MNEREIFAAVLEQRTEADRQALLDELCDDAMRQRIERLLKEQSRLGNYLEDSPLRVEAGALQLAESAIVSGGGVSRDEEAGSDAHDTEQLRVSENSQEHDDDVPLKYLEPSSREDSLGRLGHYDILEVVGRGAFGTVLRAFDEKLQRIVAIKVLSLEMAGTSPARKRFLREARSSAAVRHENVVGIYAVEDAPIPYLVMEYIPGTTLQQRLDESGPLTLSDVLRVGKQIADGLAAAHEQGLIHRDVKPGNILLEGGRDERVKITDFGLARTADDASMTQSGVIAGTPMYMAPEQANGLQLDQRADLFSFGSVLYQMISGRPPFRAPTTIAVLKRVAEDSPRPIKEIIPEVPNWMCQIISHLHAKDRDERYNSASAVGKLLGQCAVDLCEGRDPEIPSPIKSQANATMHSAVTSPSKNTRRTSLTATAAVVLVLLVGLTIGEATGVTQLTSTVIRLATGSGTLVIEADDPDLKIVLNGEEVTITGADGELTLRPGQYRVAALKDGKPVRQELVSITRNGKTTVRMTLEPSGAIDRSVSTDAESARFATMPAEQQIEELRQLLIRRNPGFDGTIEPTIENEAIVKLKFSTSRVKNISPVRALPHLRSLEIEGTMGAPGGLADLSPLRGTLLTDLWIRNNQVSDLTPLKGLPLRRLAVDENPISDFSPLEDLPLRALILANNPVRDLKTLDGLQLETLRCVGVPITDLSPLGNMPLRSLNLHATTVADLTPLHGMPLEVLNLHRTEVADLAPLAGTPLVDVNLLETNVTDLSPLLNLPLKTITLDFVPERDSSILRSIESLERINGKPAAEFWSEVDAEASSASLRDG